MARFILRTASFLLACTALASAAQTCDDDSCFPPDTEPGSVLLQSQQSIVKSHHAAPGSFSELIAKAAVTGFCKAHPCSVLLSIRGGTPAAGDGDPNEQIELRKPKLKGIDINEQIKLGGIGELAELNEGGYEMVSEVEDDAQMAEYITRVVDLYDCKVEDMGGLMGIVPWFSGTTASQGLPMLEELLLSAVLSRGDRWVSYKNTAGVTGDTAALTLSGYTEVAALRNDASMKRFVERVCEDMGVSIDDDAGLQGIINYYSGSATFQSFERLQSEVAAAAGAPHSWASWTGIPAALLTKAEDTAVTESALFSRVLPLAASKGFCISHPCSLKASLAQTGKLKEIEAPAALDEAGYEEMAAKKDDNQMADYIQRVAAEYDCKVESMGGLMGIVPWFSGTSTVQTFTKLTEVLLFAVLAEGTPWLSFKNSAGVTGRSAPLDLNGYIQIAALRKDAEMKDFAQRMCNDMKIKVLSEDGLDGVIKFYSGTSNFQSFERLQSEIMSAAASPHTWAEYE